MSCLSPEQLVHLCLGWSDGSDTDHVQDCAECRTKLATMSSLSAKLGTLHRRFQVVQPEERADLLRSRAVESLVDKRLAVARREIYSPRKRWALAACALVGVLTLAALWASGTASNVSAMHQMAQNIRQAKSYRLKVEHPFPSYALVGFPFLSFAHYGDRRGTELFLAPGRYRTDLEGTNPAAGEYRQTHMLFDNHQWVGIDHVRKQYTRGAAHLSKGQRYPSPLSIDQLAAFAGKADRDLGIQQIDGRTARGFEIPRNQIDPAYPAAQRVEVWLDVNTKLPVLIKYLAKSGGEPYQILRDIEWNVEIDPSLFDVQPPSGYQSYSTLFSMDADQLVEVIWALNYYSNLSGGRFPISSQPGPGVARRELLRLAGYDDPTDATILWTKEYRDVARAFSALNWLRSVLAENLDSGYDGFSVMRGDSHRVLLYWQADDGGYQVIFGDLHTEKMTAPEFERMRPVE